MFIIINTNLQDVNLYNETARSKLLEGVDSIHLHVGATEKTAATFTTLYTLMEKFSFELQAFTEDTAQIEQNATDIYTRSDAFSSLFTNSNRILEEMADALQ